MITKLTDTFTLANGVQIPGVGFGTWQSPAEGVARDSVICALQNGFRHIDTAAAYGNEADVGEGIRASGVARDEIFLTTKHWITNRGYTKTIQAVEASLKALNTDYIDLYLIHWPCIDKVSPNWKEVNASTWKGFEQMLKEGKIRAIGVSNFLPEHLTALDETASVKPMVNQIEFHPGYFQPTLTKYCMDRGMLVEAWSPLGCGAVLSSPVLAKIAAKHGRSAAQVCYRFALQNGVLPLTKSVHKERIIENTKLFDFELDEADMLSIQTMPPIGYSTFHATEAPADTLYGPGNADVE